MVQCSLLPCCKSVSLWEIAEDGNVISSYDNYNSDQGVIALRGLQQLGKNPVRSNTFGVDYLNGVVVSGFWDYSSACNAWGKDNVGAAKLPCFTVDGTPYQMGAYYGEMILAMKPQSTSAKDFTVSDLAYFLSGEYAQNRYLQTINDSVPTCKTVSLPSNANVAVRALQEQINCDTSMPQGSILGAWWDIAKHLQWDAIQEVEQDDISGLKSLLDRYDAEMYRALNITRDKGWTVIGNIADSGWSTDFPMTEISPNVWLSDDVFYLDSYSEFKVRRDLSWDVNVGFAGPNSENFNSYNLGFTPGYYRVRFEVDSSGINGTVTLIPQNVSQGTTVQLNSGWTSDSEFYISSYGNGIRVEYKKWDTWDYAHRRLNEDISPCTKLVLQGSMDSSVNSLGLWVKIEFLEGESNEVSFEMTNPNGVYEWDVSLLDLSKAVRILLFPQGGRKVDGVLYLSEIYFTTEPINSKNDVKNFPIGSGVVQGYNVNVITANSLTVNDGWYDFGDKVYDIGYSGKGYNVKYDKGGLEWAAMVAYVTGKDILSTKEFRITIRGEAGTRILIKPLDLNEIEQIFTLSGGDDEIVWDISAVVEKLDVTSEIRMFIFAAPGEATGKGEFTILNATFATASSVVVEQVNYITANNLSFNNGWYDGGDEAYVVTAYDGGWKVDYNKTSEWAFLKAIVNVDDAVASKLTTVKLTVQGTAGDEIIFKPFDSWQLEVRVTLTGDIDVVTVDLSKVSDIDYSKLMIFFAAPGTTGVSGSLIIWDATFEM